jgi:2-C-methyl-D-erythritol 4-phosphate cytidylyltransferase
MKSNKNIIDSNSSDFDVLAIIPSGGVGKRMMSNEPKQFMTLNGEPILLITIRALINTGMIQKFIIPTIDIVYTRKILKSAFPDIEFFICKGGSTRQDSVHNGINEMIKLGLNPNLVLIHDAVRALIQKETVEAVIEGAKVTGAAIAARPVTDTLKLSYANDKGENFIKKNVSRDLLWIAQTPQVFKKEILIQAYNKAKEEHFIGTDSSGLVERLGHEIRLVPGLPSNIKITTPEDLQLAQVYLQMRK